LSRAHCHRACTRSRASRHSAPTSERRSFARRRRQNYNRTARKTRRTRRWAIDPRGSARHRARSRASFSYGQSEIVRALSEISYNCRRPRNRERASARPFARSRPPSRERRPGRRRSRQRNHSPARKAGRACRSAINSGRTTRHRPCSVPSGGYCERDVGTRRDNCRV